MAEGAHLVVGLNAVRSALKHGAGQVSALAVDAARHDRRLREHIEAALHEFIATLSEKYGTVIGESGGLTRRQTTLTQQIADIDTQISDQERLVKPNREQLIASSVAMERAQAQINQQLQFLVQ